MILNLKSSTHSKDKHLPISLEEAASNAKTASGRARFHDNISSVIRQMGESQKSRFWKIWRPLFSRSTRFEIRPFSLLPTICKFVKEHLNKELLLEKIMPKK